MKQQGAFEYESIPENNEDPLTAEEAAALDAVCAKYPPGHPERFRASVEAFRGKFEEEFWETVLSFREEEREAARWIAARRKERSGK